jgi:hypothetical protein
MAPIGHCVLVGLFAIAGVGLSSCGDDKETGAAVGHSEGTAGASGAESMAAAGGSQTTGVRETSVGGSRADAGGRQTANAGGKKAGGSGGKVSGKAGAKGGAGGRGGSTGAAAGSKGDSGILPPITDLAAAGPFTYTEEQNVGPGGAYTTIAPTELGKGGIKHPILIFGPGAMSWPAIYQTLLNHVASHGFVIVAYNSTAGGANLVTAMDWIIEESKRDGSIYFNKVDPAKIAVGGQSAGSLGTYQAATDPRLTTTVHINGGTFAPHAEVANLVKPALFICGDDPAVAGGDGTYVSDMAAPNCAYDFENATAPVWYGTVIGSSHTTVIDNPMGDSNAADDGLKKEYLASTVAWLRWQIAGDQEMKKLFVGPDCGFCKQTTVWAIQQKNLE